MIKTLQQNPTQLEGIFKYTFVSIQNVKFLAQVFYLCHSNNDKVISLPCTFCTPLMPLGCYSKQDPGYYNPKPLKKPFMIKKLSLQIQEWITFNLSSNNDQHWNYCKVIYFSEKNWYKHRSRLNFSLKEHKEINDPFFPGCKGYGGWNHLKMRKETHYDRMKYIRK